MLSLKIELQELLKEPLIGSCALEGLFSSYEDGAVSLHLLAASIFRASKHSMNSH